MRAFGKVCLDLNDGGDIAKKLEGLLNSEVAIRDAGKCASHALDSLVGNDAPLEDY